MEATTLRPRPRLPQLALALAAGMILAPPLTDARITRIKIDAAHSIADVRRLLVAERGAVREDRRQGVRRSRSARPAEQGHRRHRVRPAQRPRQRRTEYAFNFYILKPIDLSKGAGKMMYEPPNRGGKTWAALGRVTVPPQGANGDDLLSAIMNPTVLANSFLMPRGYTIVWSGWEGTWTLSTTPHSIRRPASRSRRIATARRSPVRPTNTSWWGGRQGLRRPR